MELDLAFWILAACVIVLLFFLWKEKQALRVLRQNLEDSQKNSGVNLLQQEIIALRGQTEKTLLEVTRQVSERLKENAETLQEAQKNMGERFDRSAKVVGELQNSLGQLMATSKQFSEQMKEIESLKDILKPPKLRGGMGETLLENMIRQIFPSEEYYSFQHKFKDGEMVDAVVILKSGLVPVDAKFPLENFKRMSEAKLDQERREARREFTRNVKKHIDDISKKYIRADEGTLNFALMYVPAENIYYEIIARDDGEDSLLPYTFQKRVFPVSPHTFYAFLFTLAQWVGVMRFEEQTKQVWTELARVNKDFENFSEAFKKIGAHLMHARGQYEEASKKRDRLEIKLSAIQEGRNPELVSSETAQIEGSTSNLPSPQSS